MKWLLVIIVALISLSFINTDRGYTPTVLIRDTVPTGAAPQLFGSKLYEFKNYTLIDSFLMIMGGDTFAIPRWPALKYKTSDNRWYGYHGQRWRAFLNGTDTVSLSNRINNIPTTVPGGANRQVQYNNAGSFGGDAGFTYNASQNKASLDSGDLYQTRQNYGIFRRLAPYLRPDSAFLIGNSHTVGIGATTTDSAYAYIESYNFNVVPVSLAVSGTGALSAANRFLINRNPGNNTMAITMVGFNDPRRNGLPRKTLNKIINAHKSIFANQYLKSYTAAGGSGVTRSGSWTTGWSAQAEGGKVTNGTFSSTTGNYIEYTFTDSTVIAALMGGDGSSVSWIGTDIEVRIDGNVVATINTNDQTDGVSDASGLDNKRCAMAFIFTGLANTSHTIRLTKLSTGGGGFMICDYFGHLIDKSQAELMLWHHIPRMDATGYATAPANATNATTDTVNSKIDSLKTTYPISLYPTFVVPTNTVYNPLTDGAADSIHIADPGHRKIANLASAVVNNAVAAPGEEGSVYYDTRFKGVTSLGAEDFLMRSDLGTGNTDEVALWTNRGSLYGHYSIKRTATTSGQGLEIQNDGTGIGAANGAVFNLYKNNTPSGTDRIGEIHFYGNNTSATKTQLTAIYSEADDVTAGAENGMQLMNITVNGALKEYFRAFKSNSNVKLRLANTALLNEDNQSVTLGNITDPISAFKYEKSVNGAMTSGFVNPNTGTSAYSELLVSNSITLEPLASLRLIKLGTNWTTFSAYKQNGVAIEAGPSVTGGLSIMSSAPSARIRLYTEGYDNDSLRLSIGRIDSTTTATGGYLYRDAITKEVRRVAAPAVGPTYTFTNGLIESGGVVKFGGPLTQNTTVNTAGFSTSWTGSNNSMTLFTITNTGTTGANAISGTANGSASIGVTGASTSFLGVFGSSTSGVGVQGQSTSGTGVVGVSTSGAGLRGQIDPTSTNTIANVITMLRTSSSGAGANGLGAAIQYELETATDGTSQIAGSTAFKWTDATNATRTSQYELYGVNNAVTARKAAMAGNGQWTWDGYGAGTFTGTPTATLQTTSAGAIIEGPVLAAGTYTPTLTNGTNVTSSTASSCQYMRVGNTVTVSGKVNVTPTSTGATDLGISLPVASAIANSNECGGTGTVGNTSDLFGSIRGDATNDRAELFFTIGVTGTTSAQDWYFTFTYRIL